MLLWHFGAEHIKATSGGDAHRADSLRRRLAQMDAYRHKLAPKSAPKTAPAGEPGDAPRKGQDETPE